MACASMFLRGGVRRVGRNDGVVDRQDEGDLHASAPQCSCGVGFGESAGTTLLSITMDVPFFSFTWPLVTTCWPSFRPLRMATWSPRVSPVVTKACCTTRPPAPDAAGAGAGAPEAPPAAPLAAD